MTFALSPSASESKVSRSAAHSKLRFTAQGMRWLSAAYAVWVLWQVLNWWLDGERLVKLMGNYLQRDLSGMATWQRMGGLGLDLIAWVLLLAAVVYGWRFLGSLRGDVSFSESSAHQFMRCAQYATACQALTLLTRPVQSFFYTAHLAPAEQLFQWQFRLHDLQSTILCLALLMFALIYAWALEVSEENQRFV
jgi:hypothetical protein